MAHLRADDEGVCGGVEREASAVDALTREEDVADELGLGDLEGGDGLGLELAARELSRAGVVEAQGGSVAVGERAVVVGSPTMMMATIGAARAPGGGGVVVVGRGEGARGEAA